MGAGVAFLKAVQPGLYDAIIVDSSDPIGEPCCHKTNFQTEMLALPEGMDVWKKTRGSEWNGRGGCWKSSSISMSLK